MTSRGQDPPITRVLVVSKTHLDVGFTDLAAAVRRRYLDDFFPRAMAVAAELRARGDAARLRWTTGSWILHEALDAADPAQRRRLEAAIEAGDLCWHALPFTLHTEYCDRSLIEHGLTLAAELDRRYGRTTRAAKVTDVPGHTRGLVSLLADAGVDLLHVGVNPASSAPQVPHQFRWCDEAALRQDGAAPEVTVMYQPGGYGAVQVVEGTGTAVAVDLTGDNLGPPTAEDVVAAFDLLQERFPSARIEAATFDDVAELMAAVSAELPVVSAEIGDTWVHGTASDPVKTSGFRALRRARAEWIDAGLVDARDPVLARASTRLLLVGEHTWGMDQKVHWPELGSWSAAELAVARQDVATQRFESSWDEQSALLDDFVDVLRDGGNEELAVRASEQRAAVAARPPELGGLHQVEPGRPVGVGDMELTFDPDDGAVVGLVDAHGRERASVAEPLGRWRLQTFAEADFERWFATYNGETLPEDLGWARWDNTKPGLGESAAAASWWAPQLRALWSGERDGVDLVVAELGFVTAPDDPAAVPARAYLTVSGGGSLGTDRLGFELSWFDLPAARWPVAWWWTFQPVVGDPAAWQMEKLGELVSPLDVVPGGGRRLHAADRVVHPEVSIDLPDAPLVAPGAPRLLEWDDEPVDLRGGWHVAVYANLWGTNFPMWIEGDGRVRVQVHLH